MIRLSDQPASIEFGHFSILPHRRQLLTEGRPVRLGGRAFDLLLALIETPGAVVGKDELLSRIWPGRIVEENRLASEISALRRAFGADRDLIQTVSGRGYQFTGEIREFGTGGGMRQTPVSLADADPPRAATDPSEDISELVGRNAAPSELTDHVTTDWVVTPIADLGIGETRLGLQVAAQIQPAFAGEVRGAKHDEAERRQITAMSCEAVGVAARADGIGLEDLAEAIGAFQHCASETAAHHAGVIYRRLGNNVLVLFGYPEAHEHDAEQAIRAGLELCAAVKALRPDTGVPMRCRVGIATGIVIMGDPVEGGALRDREIVGDVPNLAARLRTSAQPDTVAIGRATRRLIGNLFDCRDLRALDMNSGTEPIRRWQVLGESVVASRFEALHGSDRKSTV